MPAQNIDDVLQILDGIIADCKAKRDPLGYFPALYRQVTLTVKKGIDTGYFDDGPRMDRFDALFANRYFAAYDAFRSGGKPTQSWQVAFDSTQSGRLIILQDLLVGINAHINLDLGVVTGETFQGLALEGFHDDFDKINTILAGLLPAVEATVGELSPLLDVLEKIGGEDAVEVLNFSLDAARDDAWLHAQIISLQPPSSWPLTIQALDDKVKFLGRLIAQPVGLVASAVALIRDTESKDVPAIIDALNSIVPETGAALP
ncbi:MAG TPA: DUF5995 family protein [Thermoanaerobaculia bacterium]|jgi:hypothetical protein|nr:DUF5995 family protein [Thermoanaerobaculia bacterium]